MDKTKLILPVSILLGCLVLVELVALSFVIYPVGFVQAISGDCSWHGGVDCSAGADFDDGSVICNDGWRESSDLYISMKECEVTPCEQYATAVAWGASNPDTPEAKVVDACKQYHLTMDEIYQKTEALEEYALEADTGQKASRLMDLYKYRLESYTENRKLYSKCAHREVYFKTLWECSKEREAKKVASLPIQKEQVIEAKPLVCSTGYVPSLSKTRCIKIPENAHAAIDSASDVWFCDVGYKEINNSCVRDVEKIEFTESFDSFKKSFESVDQKKENVSQEEEGTGKRNVSLAKRLFNFIRSKFDRWF